MVLKRTGDKRYQNGGDHANGDHQQDDSKRVRFAYSWWAKFALIVSLAIVVMSVTYRDQARQRQFQQKEEQQQNPRQQHATPMATSSEHSKNDESPTYNGSDDLLESPPPLSDAEKERKRKRRERRQKRKEEEMYNEAEDLDVSEEEDDDDGDDGKEEDKGDKGSAKGEKKDGGEDDDAADDAEEDQLVPKLLPEPSELPKPLAEPLWECRFNEEGGEYPVDPPPPPTVNKLVFVHVFKTAGSTIRRFFDEYAIHCSMGFSVIVDCSDASTDTIGPLSEAPFWTSKSQGICTLKRFIKRAGSSGSSMRAANAFLGKEMDMVGGHLPLGAGLVWDTSGKELRGDERPPHVHYVSFFRDALEKYVSGAKFSARSDDLEFLVDRIRTKVKTERAKGHYHDKYCEYLITPYQRWHQSQKREEDNSYAKWTPASKAQLVMQNLVDYNVIIGMTDRMSESMELLQFYLDPNDNVRDVFYRYGLERPEGEEADDGEEVVARNVGGLSTSTLVDEFRKDKEFFAELTEFVKFEQQITDFARQLHMKQYEAIQQAKQKSSNTGKKPSSSTKEAKEPTRPKKDP